MSAGANVWSAALSEARNEVGRLVFANVYGLCGELGPPSHDGMRCALFLCVSCPADSDAGRRCFVQLHQAASEHIRPTISRCKVRFLRSGSDGLNTSHPGQRPTVVTARLRARILAATRKPPKDGSTHSSCRKLAVALGVSEDAGADQTTMR